MDGFRFLFIFILVQSFLADGAQADSDSCAWARSQGIKSETSSENKQALSQVESFLLGKNTCPLSESFDSNRDLKLGIKQAFAITEKTCRLPETFAARDDQFLFHALSLQGLVLSPAKKLKPEDCNPKILRENALQDKLVCFKSRNLDEPLKAGDILVTKGLLTVIDQIQSDPFRIDEKVNSILPNEPEFLATNKPNVSDLIENSKKVCKRWLADPNEFKTIWVFRPEGRSKLFPTFGRTSSLPLAAITERAERDCIKQVAEKLAEKYKLDPLSTHNLFSDSPRSDLVVLKQNKNASASCKLERTKIEASTDLACVQFCGDFNSDLKAGN
jgi:hypothetical protein